LTATVDPVINCHFWSFDAYCVGVWKGWALTQ
jgi:hypothetical protein